MQRIKKLGDSLLSNLEDLLFSYGRKLKTKFRVGRLSNRLNLRTRYGHQLGLRQIGFWDVIVGEGSGWRHLLLVR